MSLIAFRDFYLLCFCELVRNLISKKFSKQKNIFLEKEQKINVGICLWVLDFFCKKKVILKVLKKENTQVLHFFTPPHKIFFLISSLIISIKFFKKITVIQNSNSPPPSFKNKI